MRGEENCRSPHPTGVRKTPGISCSVAMRRSWPCVGSASCNVYVYAVIPGIPVGLGCGRAGRSPAVRVTRTRIAQYRRRAGRGGLAWHWPPPASAGRDCGSCGRGEVSGVAFAFSVRVARGSGVGSRRAPAKPHAHLGSMWEIPTYRESYTLLLYDVGFYALRVFASSRLPSKRRRVPLGSPRGRGSPTPYTGRFGSRVSLRLSRCIHAHNYPPHRRARRHGARCVLVGERERTGRPRTCRAQRRGCRVAWARAGRGTYPAAATAGCSRHSRLEPTRPDSRPCPPPCPPGARCAQGCFAGAHTVQVLHPSRSTYQLDEKRAFLSAPLMR